MHNRKERSIALLAGHAAALWWAFPRLGPTYPCLQTPHDLVVPLLIVGLPIAGLVLAWLALSEASTEEKPSAAFQNYEFGCIVAMGVMLTIVLLTPINALVGNLDPQAPSPLSVCLEGRAGPSAMPGPVS